MRTIAVTGHRPSRLGGYTVRAQDKLERFARSVLQDERPDLVITGMALGWDLAIAEACLALDIPYIAARPFPNQQSRWPNVSKNRYQHLILRARSTTTVSQYQSNAAFQKRNQWMVDRADEVLALWSGSLGGTRNCVIYAESKRVPIRNVWSDWEAFEL